MTPDDLIPTLRAALPEARIVTNEGDVFFMHPGDPNLPAATIVTRDNDWDNASDLNRPGVLRLNIGVDRDAFGDLFGDSPNGATRRMPASTSPGSTPSSRTRCMRANTGSASSTRPPKRCSGCARSSSLLSASPPIVWRGVTPAEGLPRPSPGRILPV